MRFFLFLVLILENLGMELVRKLILLIDKCIWDIFKHVVVKTLVTKKLNNYTLSIGILFYSNLGDFYRIAVDLLFTWKNVALRKGGNNSGLQVLRIKFMRGLPVPSNGTGLVLVPKCKGPRN